MNDLSFFLVKPQPEEYVSVYRKAAQKDIPGAASIGKNVTFFIVW